jgi:hypothetical protein
MKREILDAVKRWYQYDWLAIENKHVVVPAEAGTHVRWIPAFVPNGNATTLIVDMSGIISATHQAICWWFNPSTGAANLIGSYANSGTRNFTPPNASDWVLVIDDASANLPSPGSRDLKAR